MNASRALTLRGVPRVHVLATLVLLLVSCTQNSASSSTPSATTIVTAGSPCAPVVVKPVRFGDQVPDVPSATPRPAFSGSDFSGFGKVVSLAPDGSSVVLVLGDDLLHVFGATTLKVTSATVLERHEEAWGIVASGGVAAGASEVPLAPGAPAIDAGQRVVIECHRDAQPIAWGAVVATAAPAGAPSWTLSTPLTYAWPIGSMVRYERVTSPASLVDLHLAAGDTVTVDLTGTPGEYRATKLANAGIAYEWH